MLTARQEAFCRSLAEGHSQYEAYQKAGYRSMGRNATDAHAARLARNGKVADKVAELKGQAAIRTEKTVAKLVAELDEVIVFARQCNNPSAMVSAVATQARLLGLEAPRQLEIAHKPAPLPTRTIELSQEEWIAQFSTPLRLPRPGAPSKRLKQIRAKEQPKVLAVQEIAAEPPDPSGAQTWVPREICLDDDEQ
ncbi:terminase small subunit [Phyllobacterium lublinensis]|uniref:terminase small subunit n=1 Tax=Phyllobacterium lublinensis TaxID=2875708 RepID=UPI001CCF5840|nr:terminase small subunit [Phyllobacterium sp. 2063]MBZ9654008.1 terminase small subunit [Phyllobacterium sp. 2063]